MPTNNYLANLATYNPYEVPDVPSAQPAPSPWAPPVMSTPTPPSVLTAPEMSTPFPAAVVPPAAQPPQVPVPGGFAPANVVNDTMGQILNPQGQYIENARRRGIEQAASRGLTNSSIAAGASQRAAIDAAAPLVTQALNLQGQREQLAFQGEQAGIGRNHDFNMTKAQDWLSSRQFSREFNGTLSMMPIQSAYQLNGLIQNYALDNPEVYTAEVINGMSNFFNQNFMQILGTYFPSYGGGGP